MPDQTIISDNESSQAEPGIALAAAAFEIIKSNKPEEEIINELIPVVKKMDNKDVVDSLDFNSLGLKRMALMRFAPSTSNLLTYAVLFDYEKLVDALIDEGASVNDCPSDLKSPLIVAASMGNVQMMYKLIQRGATMDKPGWEIDALACAIICEKEEAVQFLLKNHANPNRNFSGGITPLMYAVMSGNLRITQILLDHEAIVNDADKEKITPLMYAAMGGYSDIGKLLISRNAKIDAFDSSRNSALSYALMGENMDFALMLIKEGAPLYSQSSTGENILMLATKSNNVGVINELHKRNFKLNEKDFKGNTAAILAAEHSFPETLGLILDIGADPNIKNNVGENALMRAALSLNVPNLVEFLSRGISLSARDLESLSKKMDAVICQLKAYENPDHTMCDRCTYIMGIITETPANIVALKSSVRTDSQKHRITM